MFPDLQDPKDILLWAVANNNKLALVSSLGKQTVIIIDLLHKLEINVPIFTIDTGLLFAETYLLKKTIEDKYGVKILSIKPDISLEKQESLYGSNLWERDPDLCCELRKVEPLNQFLKGYDAWITGLRREDSGIRKNVMSIEYDNAHRITKINPLAYWSLNQIDRYLGENNIPQNKLFIKGYTSIGCAPCTSLTCDGTERGGRWINFQKTECGIHYDELKKTDQGG